LAGASERVNPLFGYTHMMSSPFALPQGRLVFGTDLAFGLTDFLQVGTSILRDAYQFYNANAKLSLVDSGAFAMALTGEYQAYNYRDISSSNPDLSVRSVMPGLVTAFELVDRLALFAGGNLNFTNVELRTSGIETSGYVRGAQVESDLSWAYGAPSRRRAISNVLSAGATYDVNYKIYGVGVSHHWPGFHIGLHYYPNADQYKVLPIIAGGGSVDL
jgi:hypothetical protein